MSRYFYDLLGERVQLAYAEDAAALTRLVAKVRADEREECAKIADGFVCGAATAASVAECIAGSIRMRREASE